MLAAHPYRAPLSGFDGALAALVGLGDAFQGPVAKPVKRPVAAPSNEPPIAFRAFCETVLGMVPSPAMAAIMDASEGHSVTSIDDATCERMFGCPRDGLPKTKPLIVAVCAGGRGGKTTRLAAPKMLHAAYTARLGSLAPGESAQSAVIAPKTELSQQAVDACRGLIQQTPSLREAVGLAPDDEDDKKIGSSHIIRLRRPDGIDVQVRLRAPGVGGTGGRGFVLPTVILEEAAFFYADTKHAINDEEIFAAALQRLAMPDGQMWIISTPLYEGVGVLERFLADEWGKHVDALVCRAPTRLLNPSWDPTGKLEKALRKKDPERARREIDAIPMAIGGGETFYSEDELSAAFIVPFEIGEAPDAEQRWESGSPVLSFDHTAGSDMGFRKNSSALAISRSEEGLARMVFRLELKPTKGFPLKPSEVVREFAFHCMRYHCPVIFGDIHSADATHEELAKLVRALEDPSTGDVDQRAWVERVKADPYARSAEVPRYVEWSVDVQHVAAAHAEMRRRMQEKFVALPNDERLKGQARSTRRKILPTGQVVIVLPTQGLAHGDVWCAAVIACTETPLVPVVTDDEAYGGDASDWS